MLDMNGARPTAIGQAQAPEQSPHNNETTERPSETSGALAAALAYRARGWSVLDLPYRSKRLTRAGWQHERWTDEQLRERFGNGPRNVAVLLGEPSGALIDIDLDCREALALADQFLPPTPSEFGRPSKPRSHRLYYVEGRISTEKFQDPLAPRGEAMLAETRSTGCYTVMPGSVHESGEPITWHRNQEPARASPEELRAGVARLASASLLTRHYPGQGARHELTLALAGALLSAGWDPDEVKALILAVAEAAGDEEAAQRLANVDTTARRHAEGGLATGWGRVAEIIGEQVVRSLKKWLGVPTGRQARGGSGGGRESAASVLVGLATASGAEFFHTPDGKPYTTVEVGGHRETWMLGSKHCRRWMARLYHQQTGKAAGSQAIQDALAVLTGRALFDGPEIPVYARLGEYQGRYYLDLANEQWEGVEIGPDGWRVLAEPPVRFRRARGMLGLPHPVSGGSLDELRRFVNLVDEVQWVLLVAWLLAAARPHGPYPVLILSGEQGSAKSTTARALRSLLDPNVAAIRAEPREPRDLMIAATNGLVIALDNLSRVPDWLSDALCRLATGGGFATRELYSDDEETIFEAQRPVILNGIEDLATRGDLAERAIVLRLPRIPEETRRTEKEFWAEFELARPRIVGALLDALSGALARLPETRLDRLPRMADFAQLVVAAEPALGWEPGTFLSAYDAAQSDASGLAREADSVALALVEFMDGGPGRMGRTPSEWTDEATERTWRGSASRLLDQLNLVAGEETRRARGWPKTPAHLSSRLRRVAPSLRGAGIEVETGRNKRASIITLRLRREPAQDEAGRDTQQPERECEGATPPAPATPSTPGREGEAAEAGPPPATPGAAAATPAGGSYTRLPPDDGAGGDGVAPAHPRSNGAVPLEALAPARPDAIADEDDPFRVFPAASRHPEV